MFCAAHRLTQRCYDPLVPKPESPFYAEEHEQLRQTVRRFVEREIVPHVDAWERQGSFPRELYRKAGELGLLGLGFPEDYGGTPCDQFVRIALTLELCRAGSGGIVAGLMSHGIGLPPVANLGSAELKARLADVVREAMPEVGVVSPVEVTPPTVEGSTGRSLRWMGLGALVAVLAFGGLYAATNLLSTKGTKSSAEPSVFESASVVPERPPDQAAKPEIPPEPEEEIPPEPPPREEPPPEPAAETGEAVLDTGTDGEGTTGGDAPRRIRRKPKPKKDGPKLREDNPYAR